MAQFLFVQDLPADGLQNQHMRSHSALVSHRRRRLKRDQGELENAKKLAQQRYEKTSLILASQELAYRSSHTVSGFRERQIDNVVNQRRKADFFGHGRLVELAAPLSFGFNAANGAYSGNRYFEFCKWQIGTR
jgi:hypothetical protein